MNKFITIFTITCASLLSPLMAMETSLEIRTDAFFHNSDRFRKIYGHVGPSYELEGCLIDVYNCFDGWVNFDWFSKHGRSEGLHDPTRVNIANISLGVKYPYQFSNLAIGYVGIGPSFSRIWLKNQSHFTHEHVSKWAVGGIIKSGIYYFLTSHVFFDVFVDYLYQPVNYKHTVDIGGLKVGVGLGVRF